MVHTIRTMKSQLMDFAESVARLNHSPDITNIDGREGSELKSKIGTGYDSLATTAGPGDFWNWGLFDRETDARIREAIGNYSDWVPDGFSEQLYYYSIARVPIHDYRGAAILEVASGLGAGLNFLSRIIKGARFTGIDLSANAIERANSLFAREILRFKRADAESIPFDDRSFDLVLNIEALHNFPDISKFLSEVGRVLKPGGYFVCADVFTSSRREILAKYIEMPSQLAWIGEEDISDLVRAAIKRRLEPDSLAMRLLTEQPAGRCANHHGATAVSLTTVLAAFREPGAQVAIIDEAGCASVLISCIDRSPRAEVQPASSGSA
jgi:SAM-dependent methyltransferase